MIYFLTPLAAASSVTDWPLSCNLLRKTLKSLEEQSDPDFKAMICCHDIPEFASELDERFQFIIHPFPPRIRHSQEGAARGI